MVITVFIKLRFCQLASFAEVFLVPWMASDEGGCLAGDGFKYKYSPLIPIWKIGASLLDWEKLLLPFEAGKPFPGEASGSAF